MYFSVYKIATSSSFVSESISSIMIFTSKTTSFTMSITSDSVSSTMSSISSETTGSLSSITSKITGTGARITYDAASSTTIEGEFFHQYYSFTIVLMHRLNIQFSWLVAIGNSSICSFNFILLSYDQHPY